MNNNEPDMTVPLGIALMFLLGAGFLMWTSAHVSSFLGDGTPLPTDQAVTTSVIETIKAPSEPALAWADASIGHPAIFWTIFVLQLLLLLWLITKIFNHFRKDDYGLEERDRLDAATEARLATAKDLKPLIVDGFVPDRFSLGKLGRNHLAAENRRSKYNPGPQHGSQRKQVGDRGPIMFVGPTRCGKTVGVISGILTWHGPMIAASIKDDLIRPTVANRRLLGETAVFDPTRSVRSSYTAAAAKFAATGDPNDAPPVAWDDRLCINWSPLSVIKEFDDALRVADSIADTAPGPSAGDSSKGDFWINSATQILAPLLYMAALTGRDFDAVVDWSISPPDPEAVSPYLGMFNEIRACLPIVQHGTVNRVEDRLNRTLGSSDVKTSLDGIYATLRTIIDPWFSDRLSESASGKSVDLKWLLGGGEDRPRSFYISAPPQEARRLKAVFGGCVNELIRQVYTHVEAHGPIEPPLLIVLDEAANMPLPMLPEYVSTLAGMGVQLITVFQDFGQLYGNYGPHLGGSIINNHTSRLLFRGLAEETTSNWVETATGQEEVHTIQTSEAGDGHSVHDTKRLPIVPSNVLREQPKFETLLVHGGLKPAHIEVHEWFEHPNLKARARWPDDTPPGTGLPNPTAQNVALQVIHDVVPVATEEEPPANNHSHQPTSLVAVIPPKGNIASPTLTPDNTTPTTMPSPPKNTIADFYGIN